MTNSPEDDSNEPEGYRDWSHDLAALQEIGEDLLKEWRTENSQSPRDYPAARWLTENGYSHLRWILREKHDMGTPEFFILLTSAGGSEEYEWSINDVATIERANAYLDDRVECRGWRASTTRTQRARINEVLRRFSDEYGDDRILAIANEPELKTEVYDSFKEVIKNLREELTSDDSTHHHVRATHRLFEWLDRSNRIAYDPMESIEKEFRWNWRSDSTPLTPDQVRRLWIIAETDAERMLVIGSVSGAFARKNYLQYTLTRSPSTYTIRTSNSRNPTERTDRGKFPLCSASMHSLTCSTSVHSNQTGMGTSSRLTQRIGRS